jgi:hypothetical protein
MGKKFLSDGLPRWVKRNVNPVITLFTGGITTLSMLRCEHRLIENQYFVGWIEYQRIILTSMAIGEVIRKLCRTKFLPLMTI